MLKRRYPGVSPFTNQEKNIFFGRDNDIHELLELISLRNQILLYSQSGVGKTSLLNAGIFPNLEKNVIVIKIRFYLYNDKKSESPIEKTINEIKSKIKFLDIEPNNQKNILDTIIQDTNYKKTLWYYFKQLQLFSKNLQKYLIVFDQFEEFFSYPTEQKNEFKEQLHELTDTNLPNDIMQIIADIEDKDDDDDDEIDLLYEDLNIKRLFSLRSDKMSLLNQLTDKIPDIQKTFYELKPLDIEQSKKAIINPAILNDNVFETHAFEFEDQAVDEIIDVLINKKNQNIETIQLQIVCQQIERIAQDKYKNSNKQDIVKITVNDLPKFTDIFLDYYNESINSIIDTPNTFKNSEGLTQFQEIQKFIEEKLIMEGKRISLDEIICQNHIPLKKLKDLTNTYLLRAEPNNRGDFTYELSHDTLIKPILISKENREKEEKEKQEKRIAKRKRKQELKKQKEILEKEQKAQVLKQKKQLQIEKEKRKKTKRRYISIAVILFLSIITLFSIFILIKNREIKKLNTDLQTVNTELEQDRDKLVEKIKNETKLLNEIYNLSFELHFNEANKLKEIGKLEQAIIKYQLADKYAQENNQTALIEIQKCNEEIKKNKFIVESLIEEGEKLEAQGEIFFNDAKNRYQEALDIAPDNKIADKKLRRIIKIINEKTQKYIKLAEAESHLIGLDEGAIDRVIDFYRKAQILNPNNTIITNELKNLENEKNKNK